MEDKTIITIVLVVLVLVAGVQAYQLNTLKSSIETGTVAQSDDGKVNQDSIPSNIQELPQMVGGC